MYTSAVGPCFGPTSNGIHPVVNTLACENADAVSSFHPVQAPPS